MLFLKTDRNLSIGLTLDRSRYFRLPSSPRYSQRFDARILESRRRLPHRRIVPLDGSTVELARFRMSPILTASASSIIFLWNSLMICQAISRHTIP